MSELLFKISKALFTLLVFRNCSIKDLSFFNNALMSHNNKKPSTVTIPSPPSDKRELALL